MFTLPEPFDTTGNHHKHAASRNARAGQVTLDELTAVLEGGRPWRRLLLEAAAGAGKSYLLKDMVVGVLDHASCDRVAVVAFTNRQIIPLARGLGQRLGADAVCLRVSPQRADLVDDATARSCTVAYCWADVPEGTKVLVSTSHAYKYGLRHTGNRLGASTINPDHIFDVVFVDEAWQLAAHLYRNVETLAPVAVGVGDVGQLPPFDRPTNPYRGDPGYNPTRAWPTVYADNDDTWAIKMPTVWRPHAEQLGLWRMFYSGWPDLDCVAAPGDRSMDHHVGDPTMAAVWDQVGRGIPTLIEVDGLPDPDAPDIDEPLLATVEAWLDELLSSDPEFHMVRYDEDGNPSEVEVTYTIDDHGDDPLVAILATRNGAVEQAEEIVKRLTTKHDLEENVIVASTVDSYQGQTNALTIAVHPLSGATGLNEFNSAFGRLAVVCTRATHGLLLVSRPRLDTLLEEAPARPGTPLGEPGTRELPRQTHRRILSCFARGVIAV
jgi:hypothetical protein